MNKIKQIIKCHFQGRGTKQISDLTGVARNTVKAYIRRFRQSKLTWEAFDAMPDGELAALLIPKHEPARDRSRAEVLEPLLPGIIKALRKKGMTLHRQWELYIAQHPEGYQSTQFKFYVRQFAQKRNISMHMEHKAGDKVFIDYAGKHLHLTDPETGELRPVEVFVSVLGCSQYTFVEASMSQQQEDLVGSCCHMLAFYGGVPRAIVPDNMKSAVQKGSKYAPILNETFETFGEHYNTTILPARPRHPKDKSLVEGAVKLIYQHIYAHLEDKVFTSLSDLNAAISVYLERYNDKALRGEESRRQQFLAYEQRELLPLPLLPYELMRVRMCTVMKNSHICLSEDKHYYSVPYKYMGKKVKVLFNATRVEVYYKYNRIATHVRNKRRHKYTTDEEHLSPSQRYVASWSHEFFVAEGNKISPEVGQYLAKLMEGKPHAEQGYKSCAGILHLARKVGHQRIIQACKRASDYHAFNYPIIEDILKRNLDSLDTSQEQIDDKAVAPSHDNIRGKDYYH